MLRLLIPLVAAMLAAAVPVRAETVRIVLPSDTSITFELKATMHTVHGTAELERGDFTLDTETGDASGEAVVAAASADTDNDKRDRKMHRKVLLSQAHPRISIRADRIEGRLNPAGSSELTLIGVMELIGTEHPIRVPMTVTMNGLAASVEATFTVPYVEWGLKDPSSFVLRVGKEVPVTVRAENVSVTKAPPLRDEDPAE
jgi:polyisoprenoid-binding protein YceI